MNGDEIELKLAIAPESRTRLGRLPLVRDHRVGTTISRVQKSVYFDTPDLTLARAGVTVRLRQGGGGPVQTVKTAGERVSGLFNRREWEWRLNGPSLDTAVLASTGLGVFASPSVLTTLEPCFVTDIRRSLTILAGPGWRIEMALDRGEIQAGERTAPVSEVELELREGASIHLFALARHIAQAIPVRLLPHSKSDRGHALAANRPATAVKATAPALDPGMTLSDAFRAIAHNCLHHLLANQDALRERGDGEAVHQMRVALRRLRSAFRIFRPMLAGQELDALRPRLGWLLSQLGPARDAEVFLAEIIAPVVERHPGHAALTTLRERWRVECQDHLAMAQTAVADPRFSLLLLDLGAWVEAGEWQASPLAGQPLAPFAAKVLNRLARRLRRAGGKRPDRLPPADLHRVRIAGKHLRYAGEFFAALYGKRARDTLTVLARLQDTLGEINDIAVAGPRLAACHHLGDAAWAAGLVTGWHEARRPELLATARTLWGELHRRRRFWRD